MKKKKNKSGRKGNINQTERITHSIKVRDNGTRSTFSCCRRFSTCFCNEILSMRKVSLSAIVVQSEKKMFRPNESLIASKMKTNSVIRPRRERGNRCIQPITSLQRGFQASKEAFFGSAVFHASILLPTATMPH